jgi:hypothetical protein
VLDCLDVQVLSRKQRPMEVADRSTQVLHFQLSDTLQSKRIVVGVPSCMCTWNAGL